MADQEGVSELGGTMRLGAYPCILEDGTRSREAYGKTEISERHRHRFEVSNSYREALEDAGIERKDLTPLVRQKRDFEKKPLAPCKRHRAAPGYGHGRGHGENQRPVSGLRLRRLRLAKTGLIPARQKPGW